MPNGKEAKPSGNKWAVMGGIALNVEYTRKYGFEATAAARVTARLVAIPPPAAFQLAVQADVVGRQKRAALLATPTAGSGGLVLPPRHPPEEPLVEVGEPIWDDDEEMISLLVADAAGVEYTLDDGVAPPSSGRVSEDGVLLHRISPQSERAVVQFANRSQPVIFSFDRSNEDESDDFAAGFETDDELLEVGQLDEDEFDDDLDDDNLDNDEFAEDDLDDDDWQDEQTVDEIVDLSSEDDTPTLSLMVPDKANQSYTLDDGVNPPSDGVVDADGLLVHSISPEATGASLKFAGETEAIQLSFSTE